VYDVVCGACRNGHVGHPAPSNGLCRVAPTDACADGVVTSGGAAGRRALLRNAGGDRDDGPTGGAGSARALASVYYDSDADCGGVLASVYYDSHGDCYHVTSSTGAPIDTETCVVDAANCGAKCACAMGWHGGSCGVVDETWTATITLVDDLVAAIDDVTVRPCYGP
jgi:hypothetical protein